MSQELLSKVVEGSLKKDIPNIRIGDTIDVSVRIVEGEKERTQVFTGTVIARRGSGISETFTVRRIVNNEGVERIFPIHSPKIADVKVVRSGKARRAKLYYLRDRVGKATRLKELKTGPTKAQLAAEQAEQQTTPPETDAADQAEK
ncbi:MAG: 50S ribosomal protein L19 [Planctomycetota bacterium]|nr:50S ribosomal protein L19 [Planctomycetota bacterium]